MRQKRVKRLERPKKESLNDLLDNIAFYNTVFEFGPPRKQDLIRYYTSNWMFYKRKMDLAKSETKKVGYEKKYNYFWNIYCSLFPCTSV